MFGLFKSIDEKNNEILLNNIAVRIVRHEQEIKDLKGYAEGIVENISRLVPLLETLNSNVTMNAANIKTLNVEINNIKKSLTDFKNNFPEFKERNDLKDMFNI